MRISDNSKLSDKRVTEWFLFETARKEHEQPVTRKPPRAQPVVTLSREFGAGGHTIADILLHRLGSPWQVWDREIIEAVADSAQIRTEMVEALDERTRSWIEEMMRDLFAVKVLEPFAYRHHLANVLLALAQQGHKIILGRGANFVLPDALNIRLCASLEFRVRNAMQREKLNKDDATKLVHRVDRERADFTRSAYGKDVDDPAAYDMIIRTDNMSYPVAVAAIACAAAEIFCPDK